MFTLLGSLLLGLLFVEWLLAYLEQRINNSEIMQPGLIRYHSQLGWELTPGWVGTHKHHDFEVTYRINSMGYRSNRPDQSALERVVVLGDSFTFGLGVEGHETFVAQLDEIDQNREYINLGIPGFSTDQEWLQYRMLGRNLSPDHVLIVVYLGNDLFDNLLAYPMQAEHAKPYFSLDDQGRLIVENTPVPRQAKPAAARTGSIADIVFNPAKSSHPRNKNILGRTAIARRLGIFQPVYEISQQTLDRALQDEIDLFLHIAMALQESAEATGTELSIALLPGSSYINRPASLSSQLQDYLRQSIKEKLGFEDGIEIIDLAGSMRDMNANRIAGNWYFPHEGHLNEDGHRIVSRLLYRHISE